MSTTLSALLAQCLHAGLNSIVLPFTWMALVFGVYGVQGPPALERELPALTTFPHRPEVVTQIYDRNGVLLGTLREGRMRGSLVRLSDVPLLTRLAFVAIEDARFYEHAGIDIRGILRAATKNAASGKLVEGGSTITQQLIKNRFLSSERTLKRKLQEITLALRLEAISTKDEILEEYLNEICFGNGTYGIGTAASYYFGKDVTKLDLAESAILAALVKAPSHYNPIKHPEVCRERQRQVLLKMWEQGYITLEDMLTALERKVALLPAEARRREPEKAPYFLAVIKKQLVQLYGFHKAYSGGLKVTTTLDWATQKAAEKSFAEARAFKGTDAEGAFLALEPMTGDILALIGGRDFKKSQFNRAIQARRQPGSAFKPIVYATALFEDIAPNSFVEDEPVSYPDTSHEKFWEPRNYGDSYHGATMLPQALAQSYNSVAVKLLYQVGVDAAISLARRLGISSPLYPNLALALGGSDVTLLEMVSAYSVFANSGVRAEPRALLRVEDPDGRLLLDAHVQKQDAIDEGTAFKMTQMLRGVVERGTGTAAKVEGHVVAGKTGTTNNYTDAWFIGITPEIAAGCFVMHDDHRSLGGGKAGGKVAAPIVGAFLRRWLEDKPESEFTEPPGVETLDICGETGLLASRRCDDTWSLAFDKGKGPGELCYSHGYSPEENLQEWRRTGGTIAQADPDEEGGFVPMRSAPRAGFDLPSADGAPEADRRVAAPAVRDEPSGSAYSSRPLWSDRSESGRAYYREDSRAHGQNADDREDEAE